MSFDKVTRAEEVLLALMHLAGEGEVVLRDAVIVTKRDDGKVHVHQTVDPSPAQGAVSGSIWGLLAGVIFGGPLVGLVAGITGGALLAKLIDRGLDDKWVKDVGAWMDPGTSALLLLVSQDVSAAVLRELGRFEGQVLYCTFPDGVRRELEAALGHGTGRAIDAHDPSHSDTAQA
jgi:uncharacterized membrane protein